MSTVCVIGLGYIGLPVAAMLASRGHEVVGCDVNPSAASSVNEGRAHFFEPDLQMLLSAAVSTGRLRAQSIPTEADYFIIAVPTPLVQGRKPDLSHIDAAARSIGPYLKVGTTVILESTSPVGTTERMNGQLAELRPDLRFPRYRGMRGDANVYVAHCPERILPGQMVRELMTNGRIIGGVSDQCSSAALTLYESFVTAKCFVSDCRTAEFVKLIENAYRDVNIAFANELSLICDKLGIDVWAAIELANRHPRVSILQPGAGVGGHCIAVDPWFIVSIAPEQSRMIRTAREINDHKPRYLAEQIRERAERFNNPVIACFGLTYKADVEDLRESPALEVVRRLTELDMSHLVVCDPMLRELPRELRNSERPIEFASIDEATQRADIVVFLVAHLQFRRLEPNRFLDKVVIDAVGILSKKAVVG